MMQTMTPDTSISSVHDGTLRRTVVVDGPLAFRMRRIEAARQNEVGLQILTLPQLAARLAGGFSGPARGPDLSSAVREALDEGGFARIEPIRPRPGMVRAAVRTLNKIWAANFDVGQPRFGQELGDLALIEQRVRSHLRPGLFAPRDLCKAALARLQFAKVVLGPISFDGVFHVAPVWRPLLEALAGVVEMTWKGREAKPDWLAADVTTLEQISSATPVVSSCADPRAEAVEALRWVRELIVSGAARPHEIAICAARPETWDDYFLSLSRDAEIPLHFSHGTPALASREGQACAALADVLLNGISQERVRRLILHVRSQAKALKALPPYWQEGLKQDAALFELDQWQRALDLAAPRRHIGGDPRPVLMPLLDMLAGRMPNAEKAADELLGEHARAIWLEALRRAPRSALAFALADVRIPDENEPALSPVWGPIDHLVGAPRRFVWFVGLATKFWPRRNTEDPLLPTRVVPLSEIEGPSIRERDEAQLAFLLRAATGGAVFSFPRRDSRGHVLTASPSLPSGAPARVLARTRIPLNAFSESDRLLARPRETVALPAPASARCAWRDWQNPAVTDHDGRISANHQAIDQALGRVQSATSLRLLFQDPLGFVWRYALGWQAPAVDDRPLERDNRGFGVLVHAVLKRTVDFLERSPGLGRANEAELEAALDRAVAELRAEWPLEHPVPPLMLWGHTLAEARKLARRGLSFDAQLDEMVAGSFAEVAFGRPQWEETKRGDAPWPEDSAVIIPGTPFQVRGEIDRLDFLGERRVRVTDYKTGKEPRKVEKLVLDGGKELQRVIYALAVKTLLHDACETVTARLVYLGEEPPREHALLDVDTAIAGLGTNVVAAADMLRRGLALPNPEAEDDWSDFRLALPSTGLGYFRIKAGAIARELGRPPYRTVP
jgi:hypothetical protein